MEAKEFVEQYGWDEASKLVSASCWTMRQIALSTLTSMDDLKTLVDAYELVEKFGGLFHAKATLEKEGFTGGIELDSELIEDVVLKQAIELVEQCQ